MITLKGAVLAGLLTAGFAGAALAQVTPGISGTPGRGNSSPTQAMPNGAAMSNGQQMEPRQMRSRKMMRTSKMKRSRKMRRSM